MSTNCAYLLGELSRGESDININSSGNVTLLHSNPLTRANFSKWSSQHNWMLEEWINLLKRAAPYSTNFFLLLVPGPTQIVHWDSSLVSIFNDSLLKLKRIKLNSFWYRIMKIVNVQQMYNCDNLNLLRWSSKSYWLLIFKVKTSICRN